MLLDMNVKFIDLEFEGPAREAPVIADVQGAIIMADDGQTLQYITEDNVVVYQRGDEEGSQWVYDMTEEFEQEAPLYLQILHVEGSEYSLWLSDQSQEAENVHTLCALVYVNAVEGKLN